MEAQNDGKRLVLCQIFIDAYIQHTTPKKIIFFEQFSENNREKKLSRSDRAHMNTIENDPR